MDLKHITKDLVEITVPNPKYYLENDDEPTVKIQIPSFETNNVTTMVHIVPLSCNINKELMFFMLPMVNPENFKEEWCPDPASFFNKKGKNKKKQIPYFPDHVGMIISGGIEILKLRTNYFRGLRCTNSCFKNSISMDIVTSIKNVNVKLSKEKVQMCGATSDDIAKEAMEYLIGHITTVCDIVAYMRKNTERSLSTIKELLVQTKGKSVFYCEDSPHDKDGLILTRYNPIVVPIGGWSDVDPVIYRFLLPRIKEAKFHGYHHQYIEYMLKLLEGVVENHDMVVAESPISYTHIMTSMVNYNYDLGFHIFNFRLQDTIGKLFSSCPYYEDCKSMYQNLEKRRVKITVHFDIPEDYQNKIKRNSKSPNDHTFTITKKGPVTQSGPHKDLMEPIYYKVIGALLSIRSYIEDLVSEDVKKLSIIKKIKEDDFQDIYQFKMNHPRDFSGWLRDRCRDRSTDYDDIRTSLISWLKDHKKEHFIAELSNENLLPQ